MHIKLTQVAADISIDYSCFSRFINDHKRGELTARRISEYIGLPVEQIKCMDPAKLEASLLSVYIKRKFPCLHNSTVGCPLNENEHGACA